MPSILPTDSPTNILGTLFVVATPIGNLEDITLRALRILKEVDLIAAEDTRHTRKLLSRYNISTPLISYHNHNEATRTPELLSKLQKKVNVALVTDAGTPSVSDPGFLLVCRAIEADIPIVPIPGVCAAITALSVSGLPSDKFLFVGFLPRKKNNRIEVLQRLKGETKTIIFYESPRRLLATLSELIDVVGDRKGVLARELTKHYEEIIRGRLSQVVETVSNRESIKGECTLLIEGKKEEQDTSNSSFIVQLRRLRNDPDISLKDAVKIVVEEHGLPRSRVYREALKVWKEI
jgi:16S rRNA (cytidine1402-2'-O)-methyltransferase